MDEMEKSANEYHNTTLVLSVHRKYMDEYRTGKKEHEIRRKRPVRSYRHVIFQEPAPGIGGIVGYGTVAAPVLTQAKESILSHQKGKLGISERDFLKYLEGSDLCTSIPVSGYTEILEPVETRQMLTFDYRGGFVQFLKPIKAIAPRLVMVDRSGNEELLPMVKCQVHAMYPACERLNDYTLQVSFNCLHELTVGGKKLRAYRPRRIDPAPQQWRYMTNEQVTALMGFLPWGSGQ